MKKSELKKIIYETINEVNANADGYIVDKKAVYHEDGGAIVNFDNASIAKKAAKDSEFQNWMEVGMSADISWGADKKKAQRSASRYSNMSPSIYKHIISVDSGEGHWDDYEEEI